MEVLRKPRIWFSEADDLALLREVLRHRPFINTTKWSEVASNMTLVTGKNIRLRTLRDHLHLVIKTWLGRKKACEGKLESIDYTEKDILCREIYDLMKETKTKKDREVETGLSSRDSWTKTAFNPVEHLYNNDHQSDLDIKNENIIINVSENEADPIEITEAEEAYSRTRHESLMSENARPASPALREETSSPTSNSSRLANPKKRRAVQKEYDRVQFELKKKDQELEERRLILEEKKIMLEERRLKLEETKLEIEKMEKIKNFEILEKKIELERDDRKRSDNIIHVLLKRLEKP